MVNRFSTKPQKQLNVEMIIFSTKGARKIKYIHVKN